jgi:hypothetical protein
VSWDDDDRVVRRTTYSCGPGCGVAVAIFIVALILLAYSLGAAFDAGAGS